MAGVKYPLVWVAAFTAVLLSAAQATAEVVKVNAWHVKSAYGGILYKVDYSKVYPCRVESTSFAAVYTADGATELWPLVGFPWPHSEVGERVVIRYVLPRPAVLIRPGPYRVVTHISWSGPGCNNPDRLESNEVTLPPLK